MPNNAKPNVKDNLDRILGKILGEILKLINNEKEKLCIKLLLRR